MDRRERGWIAAWAALQGIALLMLHDWVAGLKQAGPWFDVIWPLYVLALVVPLSLQMQSAYRFRKLLWGMVAAYAGVMALTGMYIGHESWVPGILTHFADQPNLLGLSIVASWFVLMAYTEHRLQKDNWASDYSLLFSIAWRNAVKLGLAAMFTGIFWGLLFLWAELFTVIKVQFFHELFTDRHFVYPVMAIVFGLGLSLYAMREETLVGVYRTTLSILGWLLPLVVLIMLVFLAALPFHGLEPLWHTGFATTLMLCLLAWMIFLFNAAWQDLAGPPPFFSWLRRFIGAGALAMPVYVGLCAYSLSLRVSQHGWTSDRIWAALTILVVAVYACGYAWAALRRDAEWMRHAKKVNIAASLVAVFLLILTCTPVFNPAKIAVQSQVKQLLNGKTAVTDFDFEYLRFQGGRTGNDALRMLKEITGHPQAALIRQKAAAALKAEYPTYYQRPRQALSRDDIRRKTQLYPAGAVLDEALVDVLYTEALNNDGLSLCVAQQSCLALSVDMNGDNQAEVMLLDRWNGGRVYQQHDGMWKQVGTLKDLNKSVEMPVLKKSLDSNDVEITSHTWRDLRIGSQHYTVVPQGEHN